MICERCGTVFCWDEADEGAGPKLYCSKECKFRAQRSAYERKRWLLRVCREHPKPAYASEEDALRAIADLGRIPPLRAYECPCGQWHLSTSEAEVQDLRVRGRNEEACRVAAG